MKRLLVEVVAIVLSILLAFSIDAWWDERKERAEEREVLESLYVEFEANQADVGLVILAHEYAVESVAALLQMSEDEILGLSEEAVEQHIRFFANPRTFDAVRGTIDALTSAGKLGILRERELREALTTFEDCAGPRQHRNCYINDLLTYMPAATPQDLLRLRNNMVLMGYVNRNKINAVRYAAEIRQAEIQIEIILKLLAKNL